MLGQRPRWRRKDLGASKALHGACKELVHAEEKGHSGVAGRMKKNGPSRLVGAEI